VRTRQPRKEQPLMDISLTPVANHSQDCYYSPQPVEAAFTTWVAGHVEQLAEPAVDEKLWEPKSLHCVQGVRKLSPEPAVANAHRLHTGMLVFSAGYKLPP